MKYRLTFLTKNPVALPVQYNQILQAALLNWLGEECYTEFLHDRGYEQEKRNFKLYTFSNIYGPYRYEKQTRKIVFQEQLQIYLSFYTEDSHSLILHNIQEKKPLRLGKEFLELYDCELVQEKCADCIVETLSPVTIHSTFELEDGRKKTYYYGPQERDFSEMIQKNLVRKYLAFYGREPEDSFFLISPERGANLKEVSIHYHGFVIKGRNGRFRLSGSEEMLRMALLSGIGARNGIGLGCILQKHTL